MEPSIPRRVAIGGLVALAACGEAGPEKARRWPEADRAALAARLEALDRPSTLPDLLAALREVCGAACACLDLEADPDVLDACVRDFNVIRLRDAPRVLRVAKLAGKYLAAQLRRDTDARIPLDDVVEGLIVIEAPTLADYRLPAARNAEAFTRWDRPLEILDASGGLRTTTITTYRFDARGFDDGHRDDYGPRLAKPADVVAGYEAPIPPPELAQALAAGQFGTEAIGREVWQQLPDPAVDDPQARPPGTSAAWGGKLPIEPEQLLLADAAGPALTLIGALENRSAAIGVERAGKIARFPIQFVRHLEIPAAKPALDPLIVDVDRSGALVRNPYGDAYGRAALGDDAALRAAHQKARAEAGYRDRRDVRITVADGVTVGQLVAILDALVDDGVTAVGIRTWRAPALTAPSVRLEAMTGGTEHDRLQLEQQLGYYRDAILQCYTTGLASEPTLEGTVTLELAIATDGRATVGATGVSEPVATCIAGLLDGRYLGAGYAAAAYTTTLPIQLRRRGAVPR